VIVRFNGGLTVHFGGLWLKLSWQCFEICWVWRSW